MIDDAAKTETIDEIVTVGGTHEATSEVDVADIKENLAQILLRAKTTTPSISVWVPSIERVPNDRPFHKCNKFGVDPYYTNVTVYV